MGTVQHEQFIFKIFYIVSSKLVIPLQLPYTNTKSEFILDFICVISRHACFFLLPKSCFYHWILCNVLYLVFKKCGLSSWSINHKKEASTLLLLSQVVVFLTLLDLVLCCGLEDFFVAQKTQHLYSSKGRSCRFQVDSLLWGKMFSACGFERVPPVSEFIGVVDHHCNLMWTTIMAATVRHQNTVAVSRCSSMEDAGKWHLWETLPPALSTCILWIRRRIRT